MNEMNDLQILTNALNAATKAGVFNLEDTGRILQSINNVGRSLERLGSMDKAKKASEETFGKLMANKEPEYSKQLEAESVDPNKEKDLDKTKK